MFEYSCHFANCEGHEIKNYQDLISIIIDNKVRYFANLDCILFFFAQFPSRLAVSEIPDYTKSHPHVLATPNKFLEGEVNE